MNQSLTPGSRSYALVNPELVQAAIRTRDGRDVSVVAELREISQRGARLLVSGPPDQLCACQISLSSHRIKSPLLLAAEIEWVRPNPAGDWLVGCRFDVPVPSDAFQELIDSGVLNRRASARERTQIDVSVQLEPLQPRLLAIVSDFSEGGLCLTVGAAPEPTRHVCVFGAVKNREVRIPLKIRWVLASLPNYFVGCQFMRRADYQVVRAMHLESEQQSLRARARLLASAIAEPADALASGNGQHQVVAD
jgi:hypothetical protein